MIVNAIFCLRVSLSLPSLFLSPGGPGMPFENAYSSSKGRQASRSIRVQGRHAWKKCVIGVVLRLLKNTLRGVSSSIRVQGRQIDTRERPF
ncbi:hypothetical protein CLOM_g3902 [Closterium sp. NIES-68]|nr:hypothetical protein CLOM_g3902 [Closterium sp. NIES-68]GJP66806.1 hypothetical protein CLOP_g23706 [Closterium sp. NIES-67]